MTFGPSLLTTLLLVSALPNCVNAASADLRAFGAACDGKHDDAPSLQKAIAAVPPAGGTVTISCLAAIGPSGVVVANKSNLVIRGMGNGAGLRALARTALRAGGFSPVMAPGQRLQPLHHSGS